MTNLTTNFSLVKGNVYLHLLLKPTFSDFWVVEIPGKKCRLTKLSAKYVTESLQGGVDFRYFRTSYHNLLSFHYRWQDDPSYRCLGKSPISEVTGIPFYMAFHSNTDRIQQGHKRLRNICYQGNRLELNEKYSWMNYFT